MPTTDPHAANVRHHCFRCKQVRHDLFDQMRRVAGQRDVNAMIGVRYDASEVIAGITKVLCYWIAVRLSEPAVSALAL
jgi:uncharacterized protein YbjQ (UPF0145 family)